MNTPPCFPHPHGGGFEDPFRMRRNLYLRLRVGSDGGSATVDFPAAMFSQELAAAISRHIVDIELANSDDTIDIGLRHRIPASSEDHRVYEYAYEVVQFLDDWNA